MNTFLNLFFIFIVYAIAGWIMESIFVSIKSKKVINRGFLIGPYCPIYGFGSLIITLYLTQYKDNAVTVFFLSIIVCSILEYFTSYFMEKIFKARWWDYSNRKFNLNGRVCGENAILFGIMSLIVVYVFNPILDIIKDYFNKDILLIFTIFWLVIFITDTIVSYNIVRRLKNTIGSVSSSSKDATIEISNKVKKILNENKNIFQKRLYKAFPNLNINNSIVYKALKDIEKRIKK